MGIPLGHDQANLLHVGRVLLNQLCDKVCPIHLCALRSDFGIPLPCSWFKRHKNVGGPMPLVRCVIPQWLPRFSGERSTPFPHQLRRPCVHTPLGTLRIIRYFIDIEDCFHVTDKGRILLGGNAPCLLLPRFTCPFCQVRRMVSYDPEALTANSTIVSASMRKVHRSWPSGA